MKPDPEIGEPAIVAVINETYGLEVKGVSFVPIGEAAVCYAVTALDRKYFFKMWPKSANRHRLRSSLQLIEAIRDRGIYDNVVPPIVARNGSILVKFGVNAIALFPFINGPPPVWSASTAAHLGEAIASIHNATSRLADVSPARDSLTFRYESELLDNIRTASEDTALRQTVEDWESRIRSTIRIVSELGANLATSAADPVVCHTDLGTNNLIQGEDGLYMMDWDDVALAPPEHDLFAVRRGSFPDLIESYFAAGGRQNLRMEHFRFQGLRTFLNELHYCVEAYLETRRDRYLKVLRGWVLPQMTRLDQELEAIAAAIERARAQ